VWTYHEQMVKAILSGDYDAGYQALIEHTSLLQNRPELAPHPSRTMVGEPVEGHPRVPRRESS
jgi:hypothetical protein